MASFMKFSDLMKKRQTLSFEVYPPKTEKGMNNLPGMIRRLGELQPDYISCTYGAGGTGRFSARWRRLRSRSPI